eukprot:COSAG02_NODE_52434_length_308_cov_0.430622_1_plen_67_part_10
MSSIWPITAASKGLTQEGSAGLGGGGSGGGRALPSERAVGSPVMFGLATRVRCVSIFLDKNRRYIGK